jgi:hypothetical protein
MRPVFGRVITGWMALRPSVQAPRRSFMRTVSAWSSRVWAVRMASAWPVVEEVVEGGVAEVAGGLFCGFAGEGDVGGDVDAA